MLTTRSNRAFRNRSVGYAVSAMVLPWAMRSLMACTCAWLDLSAAGLLAESAQVAQAVQQALAAAGFCWLLVGL
jgi:hypothetical protein